MKKAILVSVGGAILVVSILLSTKISIVLVDNIGVKKTLLLWGQRDKLNFIDSPTAYCARKGAKGLNIFEAESKQLCEFSVMAEIAAQQNRILGRLPFSQFLFDFSQR